MVRNRPGSFVDAMLPCAMRTRRSSPHDPTWSAGDSREDAVDALEDGDRTIRAGTARAALRHPDFRSVYIGAFLSNVGTWMQNVVLGALAYDLTRSPIFVGDPRVRPARTAAAVLAGRWSDGRPVRPEAPAHHRVDHPGPPLARPGRRHPGRRPVPLLLVVVVFGIGMGNALFGPTYSAVVPSLVGKAGPGRRHLPQLGADERLPGDRTGDRRRRGSSASATPCVFSLNAARYLPCALAPLRRGPPAPGAQRARRPGAFRKIVVGVQAARRDYVVWRCLAVVFLFSLLSLPFIGQMPTVADLNLGIDAKSQEYGFLYTSFGVGAVLGALSIGTVSPAATSPSSTRNGLVPLRGVPGRVRVRTLPGAGLPVHRLRRVSPTSR